MSRRTRKAQRKRKLQKKKRIRKEKQVQRMIARSLKKHFVISEVFPDEVMLLILEHLLYDPSIALGVKSVCVRPLYHQYDFWQGVENIPRLLSATSNMHETLRSTFLRVNTIPLTLQIHNEPSSFALGSTFTITLQHALTQWPAGWSCISSLSVNVNRDIKLKKLLQACPNLVHIQIHGLNNLYHVVDRCIYYRPESCQFYPFTNKLVGQEFMELTTNPKLRLVELMAQPLSAGSGLNWVYPKFEWDGFVKALKELALRIESVFAQRRGKGGVKVEVIEQDLEA